MKDSTDTDPPRTESIVTILSAKMASSEKPGLFPGEILDDVTGFPCLYRYFPGDKQQPLVVLIPGGVHLARIYYGGHPGHSPKDFLVPWLLEKGLGALAISYPIESEPPIMPAVAPAFRINEWGTQAAAVTKKVVDENKLTGDVVLVGWSMGGRIVVPYSKAAEDHGLNVMLFVALAATTGLPRVRPPLVGTKSSKAGYALYPGMPKVFVAQVQEQEKLYERTIIPSDVYLSQYHGNSPVGLLGWGLRSDGEGGFAEDPWGGVADAAAHEYTSLPWISTLWPTSQLDARHALSDRATWDFMLTQKLAASYERMHLSSTPSPRWSEFVDFVHSAPGALSKSIAGNHFFFIGETGAKTVAESIFRHIKIANLLQLRLEGFEKDFRSG